MAQEPNKPSKPDILRQAIIKAESVGFYPFSELAIAALGQTKAHAMVHMGLTNPATGDPVVRPLPLPESLAGQGKCFDSLSDAFYRGGLPEVLIITSPIAQIPSMLEDWLTYIEKLGQLGFFTPTSEEDEVTVLDQCVPNIVLASHGMMFSPFMAQLDKMLQNMDILTPRQKERLVQKFIRGFWKSPSGWQYTESANAPALGKQPFSILLAGKKSWYSMRTCNLLQAVGIQQSFNPNEAMGVLEGELQLAHQYCVSVLAPTLVAHKKLTAKQFNPKAFTTGIEDLAQAAGILPGLATQLDPLHPTPPQPATLSFEDLALLHQLKHLARQHQQDTLLETLKQLKAAVQQSLTTASPA